MRSPNVQVADHSADLNEVPVSQGRKLPFRSRLALRLGASEVHYPLSSKPITSLRPVHSLSLAANS